MGSRTGFVEVPFATALELTAGWHAELGREQSVQALPPGLLDQLIRLAPLQSPWRRELLVEAGGWTAYFNNDVRGGDPTEWVEHLARVARRRGAVATHIPEDQYPFPLTRLDLVGATTRSVMAGVYDQGRWQFEAHGEVQPFEETSTYEARLIHHRFTRSMLVRYLLALGIDADRASFYGRGVLIEQTGAARELDLVTARSRYAYDRRASP